MYSVATNGLSFRLVAPPCRSDSVVMPVVPLSTLVGSLSTTVLSALALAPLACRTIFPPGVLTHTFAPDTSITIFVSVPPSIKALAIISPSSLRFAIELPVLV